VCIAVAAICRVTLECRSFYLVVSSGLRTAADSLGRQSERLRESTESTWVGSGQWARSTREAESSTRAAETEQWSAQQQGRRQIWASTRTPQCCLHRHFAGTPTYWLCKACDAATRLRGLPPGCQEGRSLARPPTPFKLLALWRLLAAPALR
jgi:hypothetical protein